MSAHYERWNHQTATTQVDPLMTISHFMIAFSTTPWPLIRLFALAANINNATTWLGPGRTCALFTVLEGSIFVPATNSYTDMREQHRFGGFDLLHPDMVVYFMIQL